jgi:hypothetical protein
MNKPQTPRMQQTPNTRRNASVYMNPNHAIYAFLYSIEKPQMQKQA